MSAVGTVDEPGDLPMTVGTVHAQVAAVLGDRRADVHVARAVAIVVEYCFATVGAVFQGVAMHARASSSATRDTASIAARVASLPNSSQEHLESPLAHVRRPDHGGEVTTEVDADGGRRSPDVRSTVFARRAGVVDAQWSSADTLLPDFRWRLGVVPAMG